MNALELKIPPPLVTLAVGLAMWAVARVTPDVIYRNLIVTAAAVAAALAGVVVASAGLTAFRHAQTTVNPLKPDSASFLVTGGIYRVTRNPMYVGLLLVLVGWALFLRNLWSALGLVVFVAYITRFQIKPEERALLSLFGEDFVSYASRVRRWL